MELYTCEHEYNYTGTDIDYIATTCETTEIAQDYIDTISLTSLFIMSLLGLYLLVNIFKINK